MPVHDFWIKFAKELWTSTGVVAQIAAAGAIIAAGVSAVVSYLVARRGIYVNAVTIERSKWIESLRGTISKFSGAAIKLNTRNLDGAYQASQDRAADIELLKTLLADLTLRLNPTELEAKNLLRAAVKLDAAARIHTPPSVVLANEIMIRHAQWAAKAEWERVKQEASGWGSGLFYVWRNLKRRRAYNRFLRQDGSLHRLDAIGAGKSDIELDLLRSEMDSYGPPPTILQRLKVLTGRRPPLAKAILRTKTRAVLRQYVRNFAKRLSKTFSPRDKGGPSV